MKQLYVCPYCKSEHSGIASSWDADDGDYPQQMTAIFDCPECGHNFTADEGFWGYEGQPDDNPNSDIPLLNEVENDKRNC